MEEALGIVDLRLGCGQAAAPVERVDLKDIFEIYLNLVPIQ